MKRRDVMAVGMLALAPLAACRRAPDTSEAMSPDVDLKTELARVARARVLFAHQSVGRNILDGVARLAAAAGVTLNVSELRAGPIPDGAGLYHVNIGENGQPEGKLAAFSALLVGGTQPAPDVAALKFCYVDLEDSDGARATRLAEAYLAGTRALQSARPGLRLLHMTMPLRSETPGVKTRLARLIGRDRYGDADHAARAVYNAHLRQHLAGQPLLDIAQLESTRADGTRTSFSRAGVEVPTLAPEYTTDGGHLNATGQRRVAAAWLRSVAALLPR